MREHPRANPTAPTRRRTWLLRAYGLLFAVLAMLAGGIVAGPTVAQALPRGEVVSFPGGVTISNFVLPGGKRAYCIEVVMGEPTGQAYLDGRLSYLPGRAGLLNSWDNPHGMRQMNYLIDRHGQTGDAWTSAAVQLTIWRMRENFKSGNPLLNQKIAALQSSQRGRDLIARSDQLYADARANAKAPAAAPAVTGSLSIAPDPSGRAGRYRVAYPKGTESLSVTGGIFVQNSQPTLAVSTASASARYVDIKPWASEIKVTGSWKTEGRAGWEPKLDVYSTTTSSGGVGQRVAVATGASSAPKKSGIFAAVTATPPPKLAPPVASSQAQPSAEVGGTMYDELRVRAQNNTRLEMWPGASASFTAYLRPEVGAPKYSTTWEPELGEPYEAQREDEHTGELMWHIWWADAQGEPLLDAEGQPIPAHNEQGESTTGVAGDGTPYPVGQSDEDGNPLRDEEDNPLFHTVKTPVLEQRRDPVTWTDEELSAMTAQQRCLAQPVFQQTGIPVPGPGSYRSTPTAVRSAGTIHWVERVHSRGQIVHEGVCGLANETTRINQPGVVTQAPQELLIGDEAFDTATVTGTLQPGATYTLRFEAFRAPIEGPAEVDPADAATDAALPTCSAENIVFRSERVPVSVPGEYRSPGFRLAPNHGTKLWWVETLEIDAGSGPTVLHRGVCGLDNETTLIAQPTVETRAMGEAVIGDDITDTAILGGNFAANDGARWELDFRGYRATSPAADEPPAAPTCDASNLLFEIDPVSVTAPGEVVSAPVATLPEWRGDIWWVETLWLIQGDERTPFKTGECGLANETTRLDGPSVHTRAVPLATVGDALTDTATVTGPLSEQPGTRHELTFEAFRGDDELTGTEQATCSADNLVWTSDPVEVSKPGDIESPAFTALPAHGETIWWVESLWLIRDAEAEEPERHLVSRGICGLEAETTRVQTPFVSTVATATVKVGEPLFDTAIVEGALSQRDDIEYRVRFTAYERPRVGDMTCRADTEIAALSDHEGVAIRQAGRYESKKITAKPEHVGLGGYVETLVLIEAGTEHVLHRGACGAATENFEIVPPEATPPGSTPPRDTPKPTRPDLPSTGGSFGAEAGFAAFALLAGCTVIALAVVRKRRQNL